MGTTAASVAVVWGKAVVRLAVMVVVATVSVTVTVFVPPFSAGVCGTAVIVTVSVTVTVLVLPFPFALVAELEAAAGDAVEEDAEPGPDTETFATLT